MTEVNLDFVIGTSVCGTNPTPRSDEGPSRTFGHLTAPHQHLNVINRQPAGEYQPGHWG